MRNTHGYAAFDPQSPLGPFSFPRREPLADDVVIEIHYCGVCHSDLHQVRNEWHGSSYPMVPGHEIIGQVLETGAAATRFQAGDWVGVGCMVDACGACPECQDHQEQYCDHTTYTYNSPDPHTGLHTYGGYSKLVVVNQRFVLSVDKSLDPAAAAPLLCAGITTYSPLRHWGVKPGQKVGVIGLGGLGHMGIKFAHAFGAEVALFTTSEHKIADAKKLGADQVILTKHTEQFAEHALSFDFILDTVAAPHNLDPYTACLKRDGVLCLVGVPDQAHPSPNVGNLIFKRRAIAGSLIGGIRETQEMLDFCAEHGIQSDIELIPLSEINHAYERMLRSDVKYRFVLDLKNYAPT